MSNIDNPFVSRNRTLMEQAVDDEMFALELEQGNFYGFNVSAARIWALIEEPCTLDALCDALAAEFDVAPATCRSDTLALLHELQADGLVVLTAPGA